jgi:hypothetical protein
MRTSECVSLLSTGKARTSVRYSSWLTRSIWKRVFNFWLTATSQRTTVTAVGETREGGIMYGTAEGIPRDSHTKKQTKQSPCLKDNHFQVHAVQRKNINCHLSTQVFALVQTPKNAHLYRCLCIIIHLNNLFQLLFVTIIRMSCNKTANSTPVIESVTILEYFQCHHWFTICILVIRHPDDGPKKWTKHVEMNNNK